MNIPDDNNGDENDLNEQKMLAESVMEVSVYQSQNSKLKKSGISSKPKKEVYIDPAPVAQNV